jgi:hypothetical protein
MAVALSTCKEFKRADVPTQGQRILHPDVHREQYYSGKPDPRTIAALQNRESVRLTSDRPVAAWFR